MSSSKLSSCLAFFLVLLSLHCILASAEKKSYIVYMGSHSHGRDATADVHARVEHSHNEFLGSFLGSYEKGREAIFYSYKRHINGFAANLEEHEAAEIAKHPDVVSVFLNKARHLHTTHSWNFMLMAKDGKIRRSSIWKRSNFGKDIIIGNLDSGVWPESMSFSDEGYGPVPSRWRGTCENNTEDGFRCNRKLIGARFFLKGYEQYYGPIDPAMRSPRDFNGHGTHTLSTAGGNVVPSVSVLGVGNGTASGGSPLARVAAYKVCGPATPSGECFDSDMLEGFDMAIHDGVDVLSASIGGEPADYLYDSISIGTFHAVKHGIVVVCSAGNSGPEPESVTNVSPWIFTVGASTMDREFQTFVELRTAAAGVRLKGTGISMPLPEKKFYPLILSAEARFANASILNATLCQPESLDPAKVKGKILICLRGGSARVEKGHQAALAGAVGMILCNDVSSGNNIIADPHVLPAAHITYDDATTLLAYMNSTTDHLGYITAPRTVLGTKPAPFMAAFSSVGPNIVTPEILKPDITAPGVNVIASYSGAVSPTGLPFDHRQVPYAIDSGTSMSCPHVAGIAGLVKAEHPHWSPAAIKSAIMTTARTRDNTGKPMVDGANNKATPFNYGSGHIRPNRAADPGLVYDMSTSDYLNFLCALGYNQTALRSFFGASHNHKCPDSFNLLDLNYPSITIPNLSGSVTVTRRVKNVGEPATYEARIHQPEGATVSVKPSRLKFEKVGEEKEFKVTVKSHVKLNEYIFGGLRWSDGRHYVRSPIVIGFGPEN